MTMLRIGSRDNSAALWQAAHIQSTLQALGLSSEIIPISTTGDTRTAPLADSVEGKGLYTGELETALLNESIDLAVYSMNELPVRSPEALSLTALSERENPSDWLLIRKEVAVQKLFRLPADARVAASTARRKAQILHFRPDLKVLDALEDVNWQLAQLRDAQFDGAILEAAALIRLQLDLSDFEIIRFNPREFVPAPGQGVIAIQTRRDDLDTRRALKPLHHPEVARCTNVERSALRLFNDASHLPIGIYCERDTVGHYHVWAARAESVGSALKQVQYSQSTTDGLPERIFELLNLA
ncbi:MAG: hydroxymethylbilane synthase [Saprospiraceae bacterium]|nr:hydroxymethylbilane synthase [Saprospiraceae bacterium]